jgi:hypothetical protein
MLNLSDKDLDRLSQEAAQQHEPGDIVGPKFWEKLEARLDRDLGKVNPNPARGIRRLPYYYAPALLVILSATYYVVRLNGTSHKGMSSGSPPVTDVQKAPANPLKPASSSQNPVPSDNSNSTPAAPSNTIQYPGTAGASSNAPAASARPDASTPPSTAARPDASTSSVARPDVSTRSNNNSSSTSTNSRSSFNQRRRHNRLTGTNPDKPTNLSSLTGETGNPGTTATNSSSTTKNTTGAPATTRSSRDLTFSAVRGPGRLAHVGLINDSALRAFTLGALRQPIRDRVLHINRSLTFGVMGGPDYASVNTIAGDRAGSTFGLTVDYQIVNHLYVGSGLLFSRKIFAAIPPDYHVSSNYYDTNHMGMGGDVDYIKGSFNMLEIPLNLRYDFSAVGNTLFFVTAGSSSYLFMHQQSTYYFPVPYNPRYLTSRELTYANQPSDLFATLNLSMGVEMGISNSLSALISPYVKIPTRGIGFGQVQLSSFGLDFALRFAPVLSRKR